MAMEHDQTWEARLRRHDAEMEALREQMKAQRMARGTMSLATAGPDLKGWATGAAIAVGGMALGWLAAPLLCAAP